MFALLVSASTSLGHVSGEERNLNFNVLIFMFYIEGLNRIPAADAGARRAPPSGPPCNKHCQLSATATGATNRPAKFGVSLGKDSER